MNQDADHEPTQDVMPPNRAAGFGQIAKRLLDHPFWTTAGALIGIVGLGISMFQIWQAAQPDPEKLSVAMASFGGTESVPASQSGLASDTSMRRLTVGANPVEIALQNNGSEPSIITQIVAKVSRFERLYDCTQSGAGPVRISADYNLKIPTNGRLQGDGLATSDVRFEVRPKSADRMNATIGPDSEIAANYPYLVAFDLELVHDGDKRLSLGPFATLTNHDAIEANISRSNSASCAKRNLQRIQDSLPLGVTTSAELDQIRGAYENLASG